MKLMVLELPNYFSLHRLTLKKGRVLEESMDMPHASSGDVIAFLEKDTLHQYITDEDPNVLASVVKNPDYHGQVLYTCDEDGSLIACPGIHPSMNLSFYQTIYQESYRPIQFVTSLLPFVRGKEQAKLLAPGLLTLQEKKQLFAVFDSYAIDDHVFFRIPKEHRKGDMMLRSLLQAKTPFDVKYCREQLEEGGQVAKTLCKMYENPLLSKPYLVQQLEMKKNAQL